RRVLQTGMRLSLRQTLSLRVKRIIHLAGLQLEHVHSQCLKFEPQMAATGCNVVQNRRSKFILVQPRWQPERGSGFRPYSNPHRSRSDVSESAPMKAILLEQPGKFAQIQIDEPASPGAGEALVQVHRVGICGTDISGYLGKMPFYSYP